MAIQVDVVDAACNGPVLDGTIVGGDGAEIGAEVVGIDHQRQGWFGVLVHTVMLDQSNAAKLGQRVGLRVARVRSGSPADLGGIRRNDVFVSVNGTPTNHSNALRIALIGRRFWDEVDVRLMRNGRLRELRIEVGEEPPAPG